MKMTKKKVFVAALAVCLVATLSAGSLAWFSAQDAVKNEFFVADSKEHTANELFSVDVYEEVDTDGDGTADTTEDAGLEFEDVVPGQTLPKAPVVEEEPAVEAAPTTKVCPFCKSEIAIDATRCPHCTSEL